MWKEIAGSPGRGRREERTEGGKAQEQECADGGCVPGEEGAPTGRKRDGRLPHPSSGSQPPPWLGQSPAPRSYGEGGGGREKGGGPGVHPQHTPPPSPGLICLMQCV